MNIFHEKMKQIVWIFQLSSEVGKCLPGYELMMTEDCNKAIFTRGKSKLQVQSEETIDRSIVKTLE